MRRREFIALVGGAAVAWPVTAWVQQTERMRRLGVLMAVADSDADARKGISILHESLQKLGWKDGTIFASIIVGETATRIEFKTSPKS